MYQISANRIWDPWSLVGVSEYVSESEYMTEVMNFFISEFYVFSQSEV